MGAPERGDVRPRLARAGHVASSQRDRCPSAQCYRQGVADLRARIRTVVRRDGRAGAQLFPPVLCVQADFLCHESLTGDSPNPQGHTSRFGWARRVSWRQRRVPRRSSAGAREGECLFLLPKSVESSVAAFAGGLKSEVSGAGATAICTASSKRSYSSSLIALSFESSGRFARFVRIVIPQHYRRLISGYE